MLRATWKRILLFGAVGAAASFFVCIVASDRFQVGSDYLIVQNQSGATQDAYAQFKSLDYLGKVLTESVYSERFIGAVVETGKVDSGFLPTDSYHRLKEWKRLVSVSRNSDAGILHVTVSTDDQKFALRVSQAVNQVLVERNSLFRAGDDKSVEVRVLSGPVVEDNPSIGEIALASVGGFVAVALGILLWLAIQIERVSIRSED